MATSRAKRLAVGQVFGQWTVLAREDREDRGAAFWRVQCSCGALGHVSGQALRTGTSTRCKGCRRTPAPEPGTRFGRWTFLAEGQNTAYGTARFLVRCDCGTERLVQARALTGGRTSSCHPCAARDRAVFHDPGTVPLWHWKRVLCGAEVRGLTVEISFEYVSELWAAQSMRCALTGWALQFSEKSADPSQGTSASLDRIDSSMGYVPGNVQWVHKKVNLMKLDFSEEDFVAVCRAVSAHSETI